MLKLGFAWADVVTMSYARAAWYVRAVSDERAGNDGADVREATQADIDAF